MKMRKNLRDIYLLLTQDETLLRLLYYKPQNANDDPLDPEKENILDKSDFKRWEIILDVIKTTPKVDDLDKNAKCRVLFYAGRRRGTNNYLYASQAVVFDILVHFDFEEYLRLSSICDRINDLVSNEKITGIGSTYFTDGDILSAPNNYVGYTLIYTFGSGT